MDITLSAVLCNNCGRFALAEMGGSPLCLKCLTAAVKAAGPGMCLDIVPLGTAHHSSTSEQGILDPA